MKTLREADGLTSIVNTDITSKEANATKEKSIDDPVFDVDSAPIADIYASGKRFEISDNSKIYACVKVVKDIIDRQFFNQQKTTLSFQFGIDVKQHGVTFDISVNNNQLEDEPLEQLDRLADVIISKIKLNFDDSVDVSKQIKPMLTNDQTTMDNYGRTALQLIVTEKNKDN